MALIEEIVVASRKRNGGKEGSERYILKSMGEHAAEIKELFEEGDAHWKNECADMMIHCLCLFKHSGVSEMEVLGIMEKRKERFMERIGG
jgi:phosphoribosyl-ATP pyrophosphohydrolase